MRRQEHRISGRNRALATWFVVLLAVGTAGCAGEDVPSVVPLATLATEQEQWDGRSVRARGVVRSFDEPLHFWIEDAAASRVELVPHDGLEDLVGLTVDVVGPFSFEEGEGRRITVEELTVVERRSS